jgi:hypothetical protein
MTVFNILISTGVKKVFLGVGGAPIPPHWSHPWGLQRSFSLYFQYYFNSPMRIFSAMDPTITRIDRSVKYCKLIQELMFSLDIFLINLRTDFHTHTLPPISAHFNHFNSVSVFLKFKHLIITHNSHVYF